MHRLQVNDLSALVPDVGGTMDVVWSEFSFGFETIKNLLGHYMKFGSFYQH